jgi:aminoglycoside 6-adenylyltransferase
MEQLLERILTWTEAQSDVSAVAVVGSRARTDPPADVWSDLDLILIVDDPEPYLSTTDWLAQVGRVWLSFPERTDTGQATEHRVLFEGGLDVDFIPIARDDVPRAFQVSPLADIVRGGLRVLLDKDGALSALTVPAAEPSRPPAQAQYLEVVHDFLFHAVWTVKKLRRGELWVAKSCCDVYMKRLLLRMIEWHARAMHGWCHDTRYGGRFLERWAALQVVVALRRTYAHYDEQDLWRALRATMDLFRWLAQETAECLDYPYPTAADERVTQWVVGCRSEGEDIF